MFGEAPSESAVFKPLLIYEPIDDGYLDFLDGLKTDILELHAADCFFEPDAETPGQSAVVVLSGDHLLSVRCVLSGRCSEAENSRLALHLRGLKTVIRIHHTDIYHSQRYFFNNFYIPSSMASNFILFKNCGKFLDVIVPESTDK